MIEQLTYHVNTAALSAYLPLHIHPGKSRTHHTHHLRKTWHYWSVRWSSRTIMLAIRTHQSLFEYMVHTPTYEITVLLFILFRAPKHDFMEWKIAEILLFVTSSCNTFLKLCYGIFLRLQLMFGLQTWPYFGLLDYFLW